MACGDRKGYASERLTKNLYANLSDSQYHLDVVKVKKNISSFIKADKDTLYADYLTRRFYRTHSSFIWISRTGVSAMAESLLAELNTIGQLGFSKRRFFVEPITSDLQSIRNFSFDGKEDINLVFARLEYHLTKALMRYSIGLRYGFVNPSYIYNRLDKEETDTTRVRYIKLYDIPTERPDSNFLKLAVKKVKTDSLRSFLRSIKPQSSLYKSLLNSFSKTSSKSYKQLLLCNIERSRWRHKSSPETLNKYVLVNVPSFSLLAKDGNNILTMRVACGTLATKTPLLTSAINRMDINPVWIMPQSIVKKNILPRLGDTFFFAKNNYLIKDLKTGQEVSPTQVTGEMLTSGQFRVVQKGGEGNALGRIVFRFPNNFSVYLHDTSSKEAFQRFDRGVSHGCIRVEKPLDLAVFLLENKDTTFISNLKYSMNVSLNTEKIKGENGVRKHKTDPSKLLKTKYLSPNIPLFITYYTLYPNLKGKLIAHPDVYGYDKAMWNYLSYYVE